MRVKATTTGHSGVALEYDLALCEACGLLWTVHTHEGCPRCALAAALERIEEARRQFDLLAGYAR